MTSHIFNVEDAKQYGVDAAIILQNFRFWLDHNKANGTHVNDGYVWTYNSARAFSDLFPYWSANKIQKLLKKLEVDGVIITGNFNKAGYDKTKWYTLPEYSLQPNGGMESANKMNGSSQSAQPIPDVNSNVITDVINTDNFSGKQKESYRIERLSKSDFYHCHEAIRLLERWDKAYTGKLSLKEWSVCEEAMRSVDCFDFEYIDWWMERRSKSLRKNPSLPNMLCDFDKVGTTFEVFYDSVFMQGIE